MSKELKCSGCVFKKKYYREYMREYRKKLKENNQLKLPLQELIQFKRKQSLKIVAKKWKKEFDKNIYEDIKTSLKYW